MYLERKISLHLNEYTVAFCESLVQSPCYNTGVLLPLPIGGLRQGECYEHGYIYTVKAPSNNIGHDHRIIIILIDNSPKHTTYIKESRFSGKIQKVNVPRTLPLTRIVHITASISIHWILTSLNKWRSWIENALHYAHKSSRKNTLLYMTFHPALRRYTCLNVLVPNTSDRIIYIVSGVNIQWC